MPHCWKSRVVAQIYFIAKTEDNQTVNVSTGSNVSGVSTGSTTSAAAGLGSLIKSSQGQGGGSSEEEGELKGDSGENHQNNIC